MFNGPKRHIRVDTLGLLIAVVIAAASVQDRDGAILVFQEARGETRLENYKTPAPTRKHPRPHRVTYQMPAQS